MAEYIAMQPSPDGHVPPAFFTAEPESMCGRSTPPVQAAAPPAPVAPIVPDTLQCIIYERSHAIEQTVQKIVLEPFLDLHKEESIVPTGWCRYITPEGRPYFWHEKLNVYTNVYLTRASFNSSNVTDFIERTALDLRRRFATRGDLTAAHPDLVIAQLREERANEKGEGSQNSRPRWGYYFADSKRRTVFWVHSIPLENIIASCPRFVPTNEHLNLIREAQYWFHVEMFPAMRIVDAETIAELSGLLACAYADTITSTTTTSPYPTEKLQLISRVLETVKASPSVDLPKGQIAQSGWVHGMPMPAGHIESLGIVGHKSGQNAWIVARFMSVFKREMFLHYHGQDGARLNRDQSVHYTEPPRPRYLFLLVSSFLFYMPYVYKKKLDEVFVDSLLNEEHWRQLLDNLRKDWELTVTPSTVLLGANVAFLAISSVDAASLTPHRSPEQIMSYVSTMLSLASYLVCWILLQRHAPHIGSSAIAGITYLQQREKCFLGLDADAIVFSLPSAFFTWSMLLFCAAIVWICLAKSDIVTTFIIVSVLAVMALSLAVVLQVSWMSIAPIEDNVWARNVEFVHYVRQRSIDAIANGLPRRMSRKASMSGEQPARAEA